LCRRAALRSSSCFAGPYISAAAHCWTGARSKGPQNRPWNDPSGDRLRNWLGLTPEQFYDPRKVAILPMGFCYPGKAVSGDNPPRPECAPRWHEQLNAHLPNIALTLLIGRYAQASYLGSRRKATLGETVRAWTEYLRLGYLPLAHPSPRNQPWLEKNPWFEEELVRELRSVVRTLKL
jgi:uracil-DNA glycosylase